MTDRAGSSRAERWRAMGAHFSWSPAGQDTTSVQVFHVELGAPDAPVLALVHGFPTCSVDWLEVAERLSARFRVCALDFPGYGFSSKPRGWGYSLRRDAELLDHYLAESWAQGPSSWWATTAGTASRSSMRRVPQRGGRGSASSISSCRTPTSSFRSRT